LITTLFSDEFEMLREGINLSHGNPLLCGMGSHTGIRGSVSRMNILAGVGMTGMGGLGGGSTLGGYAGATSLESRRQIVAEMISQIRKYDPYPCILGIPVMPALFTTCKFYIFVCFLLIGTRIMVACLRMLM
jgi:hypothetical protein